MEKYLNSLNNTVYDNDLEVRILITNLGQICVVREHFYINK